MTKKIPVGIDDFSKMVNNNFLFIDKSLFIKELIDEGTEVSLIIRPRRWGKTLNMSMLQCFFSSEINGIPTKGIFDNLNIAKEKNGDYIEKYQGKYPVIFISFKDVKQDSWDTFFQKITKLISKTYREYEKILIKSTNLTDSQKTIYKEILSGKINQAQLEDSLKFLSECLYYHYNNQNVIILIDEYDTPLNAAYNKKYFEQTVNFFKCMFGAALKGNVFLEKGVMTGILRLSKNKMLSDINNLSLYSFMEKQYSNYFGFSEQEVIELFKENNVKLNIQEIRHWYNGYNSGVLTTTYNPWSILNCIKNKGDLKPYWIKTGDEALLQDIFSKSPKSIENNLVHLLEGGTIKSTIDEYISFDQINSGRSDVLWSLLWTTGYLKFSEPPTISEMGNYVGSLAIPNYEVSCSFRAVFPKWIRSFNRIKYDSFLNDLALGNVDSFTKNLEGYMLSIPSWFDFTEESNYHTFLLGLTASLTETHEVISNKEVGLGRVDFLLTPKDPSNNLGIVIEFKRDEPEKDLKMYETLATAGLKQIDNKKYSSTLKFNPHINQILNLCIVFYGKQFVYRHRFEQL